MTSPSGGCGTGSGPWLIQGEQADTIVMLDHIEIDGDINQDERPGASSLRVQTSGAGISRRHGAEPVLNP
jgi:hypothetical protein